jgi:acetolactate synthase-1/3 small subunit
MEELHPISVLVRNQPGVLARVAMLFAHRGFNINSLAVGETDNPLISRISVVVGGDEPTRDQVVKQLRGLVCVLKVTDLSSHARVERGLAMIKVKASARARSEIQQLADIFRATITHVDRRCMVVEVSGTRDKVQALINLLAPYGILEMARTGQIMVSRTQSMAVNLEKTQSYGEAFSALADGSAASDDTDEADEVSLDEASTESSEFRERV